MPEFQYKAKDAGGQQQVGTIQAISKASATSQLRQRGWVVFAVETLLNSGPANETLFDWVSSRLQFSQWMPLRSIALETSLQQLAMMLRSGMTLLAALEAITRQANSRKLADVWRTVSRRIQKGSSLAQAMSEHRCFPEFVIRLVKVGEQTGELETVLNRATQTMRDRRVARESLVSATIYPVLVLILAFAVAGYMVFYLIPKLETYLQTLGKGMPAMTQSLIDLSYWTSQHYVMIVVILLSLALGIFFILKTREGRFWIDRAILYVPVVGTLIRLGETTTFARSLSIMLKSGITLSDGLGTVEKVLSNRYLMHTVATAREKIIRGSDLVDALQQRRAFTPILGQMVAVGQQSGDLSLVLSEVSTLHEAQFKSLVKRLNAILTPLITLLIGGIVGYVYIAFFMALVAAGS